jgi:hypothetical protein
MVKPVAVILVLGLALGIPLAGGVLAQEEAPAEQSPDETQFAESQTEEEVTQEDLLETRDSVHGKRGRRLFKTAYWAAGLTGEKKEVYESYGYPSSRYREEKAGIILEKWTYLEDGKQFIFRDDMLWRTREFNPGSAVGLYLK